MVSSQRRLERKLKELNITLDEERQQHAEQRDQVTDKHLRQTLIQSMCLLCGWSVFVLNTCLPAAGSEAEGSEEAGG